MANEVVRSGSELALPGFTGQVIKGQVVEPDSFESLEWLTSPCDNSGPNCAQFALLATGHIALRSSLNPNHVAVMHPGELPGLRAGVDALMGQMALAGNTAPAQIEA